MKMTLKRYEYGPNGVFGTLIGDNLHLETLEHSYNSLPKVPKGNYTCVRYASPRFKKEVFMLKDVPGHSFIEFHSGNVQADSEGCILLGLKREEHAILQSRSAVGLFMKALEGLNEFTLEVV